MSYSIILSWKSESREKYIFLFHKKYIQLKLKIALGKLCCNKKIII